MATERNNITAGLFVLLGIILGFAAIVVLSDIRGLMTPMQEVQVRFELSDGLQGLKQGASVTIGDDPAGSVVNIEDVIEDQRVVAKRVTFRIPERYRLYENAVVELVVPPLGSGTRLNIQSFGAPAPSIPGAEPQGEDWAYEPGETIQGGVAPSQFAQQFVVAAGIEDEQRAQVQNIIANVDRIIAELAKDPQKFTEIINNVRDISANLDEVIADVNKRRQIWFDRLDSITEQVDGLISDARAVLQENRENLRQAIAGARDTMDNASALTARARAETLDKVHAILDKASAAVDDIKQVTGGARTLLTTQKPVLERMIANLRLTSDQLKLASIEIRRSPWRLLYRPSDEELETDNLYDAARSFALAAGTLDSTVESLRLLVEHYGDALDADSENVRLILANLYDAFEQFSRAEHRFWDALGEPARAGTRDLPALTPAGSTGDSAAAN
jgi:ABC-type transporter Mla subunit MlaD